MNDEQSLRTPPRRAALLRESVARHASALIPPPRWRIHAENVCCHASAALEIKASAQTTYAAVLRGDRTHVGAHI